MPWKPGTKLRSAADSTEVIVIRVPGGDLDLRCGGHAMMAADSNGDVGLLPLDPQLGGGTQLGKRYVNEPGDLEVLCTKAGPGSLSVGAEPLSVKNAKPLPASDLQGEDRMGRLDGKVAIVTGGAGGIGSATCRILAREGAAVVVADLPKAKPSALADDLARSGFNAIGLEADITDEAQVEAMIRAAVDAFGRIDGLHANAAATHLVRTDGLLTELSRSEFEEAFQVNVIGTWLCCKHAIPVMIGGGGGSIVATSSAAASRADRTKSAYGVTKAGVSQLMRTVATQFGKQGIRANTILPGLIDTPGNSLPEEFKRVILDNVLTPEFGGPEAIGSLVAYLLSDDARYLQGQEIPVDGGLNVHVVQLAYVNRTTSS